MFPSVSVLHVTRVVRQVCLLYSIKDQCQLNFFFSKMFSEESERKDTAFALTELIQTADSQKHYDFSAQDQCSLASFTPGPRFKRRLMLAERGFTQAFFMTTRRLFLLSCLVRSWTKCRKSGPEHSGYVWLLYIANIRIKS